MTTIYEPTPHPNTMLREFVQWIAQLFGLRVVAYIDDGRGNSSVIECDRRMYAPERCWSVRELENRAATRADPGAPK